ncbi:hypothetical protein B0A48_16696 [Cryoendolithus antarcticus]|uniref:ATP-dependent DNA helicase II subunit 2 n=1 Tax=Cryoendolithus antarcticus TaxID=1507870 RepID=A0A1V8SEE6_9PEZI|nr:hypothetical protein B0A48_16696 [Cryoendolithus antarcticus]
MAQKEATVYIVDIGSTMGERSHGRKETNLDFALEYVWDKIMSTVASGRKTAMAGVVAVRTDETLNSLGEGYEHISILHNIAQVQMPQIRKLQRELVVSNTHGGDIVSAMIVAIQMITETCKKLKYDRKIVLVTDARGPMDVDDLPQIRAKLQEDDIQLTVLGVDFDDSDYGFKEESKDSTKAQNEGILRQFCDDGAGVFGTLAQAVDEISVPRVKQVRPTPLYKGKLHLGNAEQYETAITINVERYSKTMVAAAPTASSFVVRSDIEATQSTQTVNGESEIPGGGLASVKSTRTYQVEDEHAPGGKRDVALDELAKGFEYGRTAVHISESDRNITTYETEPDLDILGFVEAKQYERYMDMSRTNMIMAERTNEKAYMALSSLIHALYELESYAVARFVAKENKEPRVLLLMPSIEPDFECLYDVELPFAEDVRSYRFPSLDKVITVGGKVLTLHRNLPSNDLKDAMSDLVDSMDLSEFGKDDNGQPTEYAPVDEAYSMKLHRINQVIKHRATHPDREPPDMPEVLTRFSRPPDELASSSKSALASVIKAAEVKKVPPKARGKQYNRKRETDKPLSDLDIGALLAQDPGRKSKRIDPKNAIPEFKQAMLSTTDNADIENAVKQMKTIIYDWTEASFGGSKDQQVVEGVSTMREELLDLEVPYMYNEFLRELKGKMVGEELGGDRRLLWVAIKNARLGLVQRKEVEIEGLPEEEAKALVNEEEAKAFWSMPKPK